MTTRRRRTRSAATLAIALLGPAGPALAQTTAAPAPSPAAPQPQPQPPQRVVVDDITVTGNTLLPAARLAAALAPFRGERSLDELKQAAQAVQALYRDAGYGAVVAYLPEQPLGGGRVVIAVLEGHVSSVVVIGNERGDGRTSQRFTTAAVRRALPALQEGRTPSVQRIDEQVQLANENPARRLAVTLEAGREPGEVEARITVDEDAASRYSVTADNTGAEQTGRLRLGVAYQNAALFDTDQQLAVQAQFAPEHPSRVRIASVSWRAPLYDAGLLFGAYATWSSADAGATATAAGALQFAGRGRVFGASLLRVLPRDGEFDQRLTLSLDQRDYLNNCAIEGLPAGACGSAGESVTVHPLTLQYGVQRGGERPLGLTLALAHNLGFGGPHGGADDFEAVRSGARRHYTALRAAGFGAVPLPGGWRLNGRLIGQVSGDALVPGEQFGVTGGAVVRGYDEREVTGDTGGVASVELFTPAALDGQLRGLAFVDAGQARNRHALGCNAAQATRCSVAAVGVGGRLSFGALQLSVDLAQALKAGRSTARNDRRLHFQASLSFP